MMADKRGRFITLEGAEGVGKTSLLPFVEELIESFGVKLLCTREPGGTPLGEDLREVLLNSEHAIVSKAEALLMFAARAQHVETVIEPALADGVWVLCDRFTDASYAYQGGGRNLGAEQVAVLEQWVHGYLQPDLTLLLDASRETSLARMQRRRAVDRIEREDDLFFERVRQGYHMQAQAHPNRVKVIDANPDFDTVCSAAALVIEDAARSWGALLERQH
jgi:dTMP kinase